MAHPQGVHYAEDLVRLARSLGDFCVGVAAFPECHHPGRPSAESDVRYLVAKLRAGAQFAITQMFFRPEDYLQTAGPGSRRGCGYGDGSDLPGIMPITTLRGVQKMAELSGCTIPPTVRDRLAAVGDDPAAVRQVGVDVASELCERLLAEGVRDCTSTHSTGPVPPKRYSPVSAWRPAVRPPSPRTELAAAPQRALYPDADAHPSTESVTSFLRDNGIEYIYADALHPNSLVPGAVPVATSGDTQVLRIP